MDTQGQFEQIMKECRELFAKKLHDYGAAWRILRTTSVTDQIFIKASRIRSLEVKIASKRAQAELAPGLPDGSDLSKGVSLVGEGIRPEFVGIVNYSIVGLIQLELGYADAEDMTAERALEYYDKYAGLSLALMLKKNHDYDEAWRGMRVSSYTDLILMKLYRTKQIETLAGQTLVSEGVDANYMDMMNYAVFGLIKLTFGEQVRV